MAELNLYHIDQITSDVKMQEIGFSHLFHDLVDHICCDVEYHMQQGMSFDEAYNMVKAKIGFRGLKKIQEDTLYVVDSKYRNMKKLMTISGVAGTVLLGFAAIFKISHWPLSGVMVTLGALILAFLFLPSALTVLWKETKNQKKLILFISAFISGVAFIFGMVLKIQHWPGASWVITFGLFFGIFLFVPALLFHLFADKEKARKRPLYLAGALSVILYCAGFWFRILHWPLASTFIIVGSLSLVCFVVPLFTDMQWKNENHVNARFIFMIVAPLLFIIPGALVNLNLEANYEGGFYLHMGKQEALLEIQKEANSKQLALFKDSAGYQQMNTLHTATEKLLGTINLIQNNMVKLSEDPAETPDQTLLSLSGAKSDFSVNYGSLSKPFDRSPSALLLLPGSKARQILENEISGYMKTLSDLLGDDWSGDYKSPLNASVFLPGSSEEMSAMPMVINLYGLSLLESGILITESAAIKQLASN
jgi:uncharacterized protein with PQ loop repeat